MPHGLGIAKDCCAALQPAHWRQRCVICRCARKRVEGPRQSAQRGSLHHLCAGRDGEADEKIRRNFCRDRLGYKYTINAPGPDLYPARPMASNRTPNYQKLIECSSALSQGFLCRCTIRVYLGDPKFVCGEMEDGERAASTRAHMQHTTKATPYASSIYA